MKRTLPPRRLSPVSAATQSGLAVVELQGAAREAALKMPIKDAMRELGGQLAEELDTHLAQAIESYLGRPIATEEDVAGHLTVQADPPQTPDEERGDTYMMDGTAILWVGPVKLERIGDPGDERMQASRSVRHYCRARNT